MGRKFTCASCGLECESQWTDEDAAQEAAIEFPKMPLSEMSLVCDPCYDAMMAHFKPQRNTTKQ